MLDKLRELNEKIFEAETAYNPSATRKEILSREREIDCIKEEFKISKRKERKLKLDRHIEDNLTELKGKREKLVKELESLEQEYKNISKSVSESDIEIDYDESIDYLGDLQELKKDMEGKLLNIYKTRARLLIDNIEVSDMTDTGKAIKYINGELTLPDKQNTVAIEAVHQIINLVVIDYKHFEKFGKKGDIAYGALILGYLALLIEFSTVVIPIFMLFIITAMASDYVISSKIYKGYIEVASLVNTLDDKKNLIESIKQNKIKEAIEKREKELKPDIDRISKGLEEVGEEIEFKKISLESSFEFEPESDVSGDIQIVLKEIEELKKTDKAQKERIATLKDAKKTLIQEILDSYFNNLKRERVFESPFFYGIEDGEPVILDNTAENILFIYEKEEDIINFVKLTILNIIVNLRIDMLAITLIDDKYIGKEFRNIVPTQEEEDSEDCFRVLYEKDSISKYMQSLIPQIDTRTKKIRPFLEINEYNKKAIKEESQLLYYMFGIYIFYDRGLIMDKNFRQCLRAGDEYGIYSYVCIKKDELDSKDAKPSDLDTYSSFDSIYLVDSEISRIDLKDIERILEKGK